MLQRAAEYRYSFTTVPLSFHRVSERLEEFKRIIESSTRSYITIQPTCTVSKWIGSSVWASALERKGEGWLWGSVASTNLPVLNVSNVLVRSTTSSPVRPLTGARRGNMAGRPEILATLLPVSARGADASLLAHNTRVLSVPGWKQQRGRTRELPPCLSLNRCLI